MPNKYIDDDFILKNNSEENKTILRLTNEIKELRQILQLRNKRGTLEPIQEEFIKLKEENNQLKKYVNNINNNDMIKLIQENEFLKNQIRKLTFGNNNNIINNNNINNDYNSYSNSNYNSESSTFSNKNLNTQSMKSINKNNKYSKYNSNNVIDYKNYNILSQVGNSIINDNNSKSDRAQSMTKKTPSTNSYFNLNIEPSNSYINNNIHTYNNNNKKNNSNKGNINSKLIEMTNKKLKMLDELQMKNRYQTQQMINALRNKSLDNKKNNYNFPKTKMERELGLEFD